MRSICLVVAKELFENPPDARPPLLPRGPVSVGEEIPAEREGGRERRGRKKRGEGRRGRKGRGRKEGGEGEKEWKGIGNGRG